MHQQRTREAAMLRGGPTQLLRMRFKKKERNGKPGQWNQADKPQHQLPTLQDPVISEAQVHGRNVLAAEQAGRIAARRSRTRVPEPTRQVHGMQTSRGCLSSNRRARVDGRR
jgi:hypothetical protein